MLNQKTAIVHRGNLKKHSIPGGMKLYACLAPDGRVRHVTDVIAPLGEAPK